MYNVSTLNYYFMPTKLPYPNPNTTVKTWDIVNPNTGKPVQTVLTHPLTLPKPSKPNQWTDRLYDLFWIIALFWLVLAFLSPFFVEGIKAKTTGAIAGGVSEVIE